MTDGKRGGEGGGDSRRKKARYMSGGGGGAALPHGTQGVLVSTDPNKDRVTCAQLSDFFTEVWDDICPLDATHAAAAPGAVDALIAAEVAGLKDPKAARFTHTDAGSKGFCFMRMHADAPAPRSAPSVTKLVHAALTRARDSGQGRARFAHRVLPVESICFASVDDIVKAAAPLVAAAFPASPTLKFAVQLELRSCDGLKLDRKAAVDALAALVPAPHTVDLSNPDRVIMVQVIRNAAALAILSDYYGLCKYNLRTLVTPPEAREGRTDARGGSSEAKKTPVADAVGHGSEEAVGEPSAPLATAVHSSED